MARQSVLRLLETAFRRWWLCLVPVGLMAALAFVSIRGNEPRFESTALVRADEETLLTRLSDSGELGNTFDTPADIAARQINEFMHTDSFVQDVLDGAGIDLGAVPGILTLDDVRSAVLALPAGDNLLNVRATTVHPEASLKLAEATIDAFIKSTPPSPRVPPRRSSTRTCFPSTAKPSSTPSNGSTNTCSSIRSSPPTAIDHSARRSRSNGAPRR
jgi:hypothetical protein